jgi:flagellar FliL protein
MEEKESAPEEQKPKKGRGRLVIIIAVVAAVAAGGAAAAFFLGVGQTAEGEAKGKTAHGEAAEAEGEEGAASEHEGEGEEGEVKESIAFESLVIDLRDENDKVHHLKVGMSAELAEGTSKEQFAAYTPRGREAAIMYLRGLRHEVATSPEKFESVKEELSKRVREAMGKKRVKRVLITDFVSQ